MRVNKDFFIIVSSIQTLFAYKFMPGTNTNWPSIQWCLKVNLSVQQVRWATISLFEVNTTKLFVFLIFYPFFLFWLAQRRAFVLHEILENITRSRLQSFPFEFRSFRVKFWFKESCNVLVAGGRCLKELQKAVLILGRFFFFFYFLESFLSLSRAITERNLKRLKTTLNRLLCFGPHSNFYSNDHPIASRKRKKTIHNSRGCSDVTPPPHVSPSLP